MNNIKDDFNKKLLESEENIKQLQRKIDSEINNKNVIERQLKDLIISN
jgi:hypothetical protein